VVVLSFVKLDFVAIFGIIWEQHFFRQVEVLTGDDDEEYELEDEEDEDEEDEDELMAVEVIIIETDFTFLNYLAFRNREQVGYFKVILEKINNVQPLPKNKQSTQIYSLLWYQY